MTTEQKHTGNKKKETVKAAGWIAGAVLIVGLAVLGGLYLEQNTRISGMEFKGNVFTEESALSGVIEESPEGMLADSVNFSAIFSSLRSLPYVEDVSLSMSRRGTLSFTVKEHQPLAMLVDGSTRSYVAKGGIKLPMVSGLPVDVPLVYGFSPNPVGDTLSSVAYRQVEEFLTEARKNEFGWITISEVIWSDSEGVIALSHENGVRLVFGHENFAQRLRNWEMFYGEVIAEKGIEAFSNIDLRFRNQIVTR